MPYTDGVSSVSGRNSRASNVSGATGASRSVRSPPPSMPPNDTLANAGVLSMLKTSTDTGDIGALSFNSSRLPSMPRATHQRRGHASRPSVSAPHHASSNHSYAPSQTSRVSSQWDNASTTQRRGSLTSMQSMPPSLPPAHLSGKPSLQSVPPTPDNIRDSRSYSMTSAPAAPPLPRHRSATSLKSQGHEPRYGSRMPPGAVPPMPENRPPFVYPTRLKRPGFRSPSPALSDTYAHGALPGPPPMAARAPPNMPPQQAYAGYNAGYGAVYSPDPRHLNVRPPPRTANTSPGPVGYDYGQYTYPQGNMRTNGPVPPMPNAMSPPQMPMQAVPGHMPPRAAPYPGPHYGPPRPPYSPYAHVSHGHRGPPPTAAPMAHQMFHNAARMARQLPHRTDTPMTDMGVPSSDPPSSGSAPTSSNPPTPKDLTTIQVVVDPAFINPDLVDLPESSSDPVLPAKYFDYAEGLEKPIHDPEMEVPHPSVPPSGFVQRVRAMLESKAAAEAAAKHDHEKASRMDHSNIHELDVPHDQDISELVELHELAANETPRFTIIEEFEAPVELPASPVRVPELEAVEVTHRQTGQRITREMVKAELGPSSVDNTQMDDTSTHLLITRDYRDRTENARPVQYVDQVPESPEKERRNSVGETVASESIVASLPTCADYAMRFSGPVDTTVASDETQSRDPFMLDADTITIEHQQSKEIMPDRLDNAGTSVTPEPPRDHDLDGRLERSPVSPLRSDEEVKRTSAVSPIQTEITMGIEETIRLGQEERTEVSSLEEQSNVDTSSLQIDSLPPPTPRTPKTYSKSVQLQPSVNITDSNSTGSNRFSLPGDLSTIYDTTVNSGSEMVTDVAVRFSLPSTTITIGKPQIVEVSPGSTPDRPKELTVPQFATRQSDLKSARRSSVTFADEVAPLNINKKAEHRPLQGTEVSSSKGKSIIRKPSPLNDSTDSVRVSRDKTIELRFDTSNNFNGITTRFGSTHLPGLKEESIEDMSLSDKRLSGHHEFPLPARIAAVKAMQERRLQESADKAKARRQARQHNRPLADTRDLPSLNFSRIDLIDRLNEALVEVRPAKSMDVVRRRDVEIYCPSPQRPTSTEPLRERYTSFFSKPEDFSFFDDHTSDVSEDEEEEYQPEVERALVPAVPTLQIQEQTVVEGVEPEKRPLSPEDFLNVATQVQRLSIPTVNGLSNRLSELIPGLRNLSSLQLDNIFASHHDLRRSLEVARPDTVMTNRTSAGFRTLAERAEEIVKNGTHDSIAPILRSLNKDLLPLPESTSVDMITGRPSADGKQPYLSGSVSAPTDLDKVPSRPLSALLRAKAPATMEEVQALLPKETNPITRNTRRSMIISQTSRPWNQDENYPWSSKVDIDLSVPSQAHTHNSFASEVLRERRTKSLDLSQPIEPSDASRGLDIGSITTEHLGRSASVTTEQATGISPQHTRKQSKRSIIGSFSKKFGLSAGKAVNSDDDPTTKSLPRSPVPRRCSTHQSHKPGDRYPTSGLTPPAGFNLDEVRSFFSDNSSERDRTASFRKRLTTFKSKSKHPNNRPDVPRGQSFDGGNTAYDAGSLAEARAGADSRAHTYDGVGMSKTEFHFKRFGEKLRLLFAKGGQLIRSLSTKGRPVGVGVRKPGGGAGARDEWLADSLYSGV